MAGQQLNEERLAPSSASLEKDAASQQSTTSPARSGQRIWGVLAQVVLLLGLLMMAFVAGWLGHESYAARVDPKNPSKYYANLIQEAWATVDQNYVDRKAVNYQQMAYKAIQAMLDVLHDNGHTQFLTPHEVQVEHQQFNSTFTGIGVYLHRDPTTHQLIITASLPNSPAERAGLKHGDILVAVAGVTTRDKDPSAVSTLLQGSAGTAVSLTILRPATQQILTIEVIRAEVKAPDVLLHMFVQNHIAHIQVVQFSQGVSDQLKDALLQAKKQGATSIILDLRDNPGGIPSEAVSTVSEFLQQGTVLFEQASTGQRTPYGVTGDPITSTAPLVVLVNENTASVAEIVTGALQDNHRAIILGTQTYGTGTLLQELLLSDGSAILLGTQEWLTPNGHFLRNRGISPDIIVTLASNTSPLTPYDENAGNMSTQQILMSGDTQLAAALQYLEKQ